MKPSTPTPRILCAALVVGVTAFAIARWVPSSPDHAVGLEGESSPANPPPIVDGKGVPGGIESPSPAAANADRPTEDLFAPANKDPETDVFRAADQALSLIAELSAADFAEIARQRKLPPRIAVCQETPFGREAARSFVERWLEVEPAGAMPALLEMVRRTGQTPSYFADLRAALIDLRPAQYLASIIQTPNLDDVGCFKALTALARTQPEAARQLAAKLPEEKRSSSGYAILLGLAEADPAAAVRQEKNSQPSEVLVQALKAAQRVGPGRLREVLAEGGENILRHADMVSLCVRYPEIAAELKLPGDFEFPHLRETAALIDRLPVEELPRRLASSAFIPKPIRQDFEEALLDSWAAREPQAAIEWALNHVPPDPERDRDWAVATAYSGWQKSGPEAALVWWEALGDARLKAALGQREAATVAEQGQIEKALAMSPKAAPEQMEAIGLLAVEKDPAMAARWLAGMPPEAGGVALREAVEKWHERDASAVEAWAAALPKGGQRDAVASGLVRAKTVDDPVSAAKWIGAIGNEELRATVFAETFALYRLADPAAARAWLREAPGVPEELRQKLLAVRKKKGIR